LGYFNNDSLIDIAVCNAWNFDSVSILLGDTGSMFKPVVNFYAGYRPFEATAADFNLDGKTDLALTIANYDSINILIGNGDGTFQQPFGIASGDTPHGIIAIDIEGDSDYDLLNVNYLGGGSTYLYLNSVCPKVTFQKQNATLIGSNDGWARAVVTGGLRPYTYSWDDPASQSDSVASNLYAGLYTVTVDDSLGCHVIASVEINNPVCTMSLKLSKQPVSVIGGNDGQAIVTPLNGTAPFSFLWDDANAQTDSIATGLTGGAYQVIVTDSVGCIDTGEVIILELPCINAIRNYSGVGASDVEICYINSDSILDMVTLYSVAYSTDKVRILFGNGDGTFTYHSSFTVGTGGDQPMNLEVNDFNGDNINDIVVTVPDGVNGFSVYLGNGDSTFQTKTDYYTGSRPWDMVSHDIDYDGDMDLMICRDQGGDFRIYKNNGSGIFSYYTSKSLGSATYPKAIEAGYFNDDTLIDVVVAKNTGISVFLGHPTFYFLSPTSYIAGLGIRELTLGDFNNDSITDIAASSSTYDEVYVFIGNGDGTFKDKVEYMAGDGPRGIEAYDMNGDANLDLVISNNSDSTLFIMLGDGSGVFDSTMMFPIRAKPFTSAVADIDDDGDMDLVVTLSGMDSVAIVKNCFLEKCIYLFPDSLKLANRNMYNGYISVNAMGKNPPFSYQWNDPRQQQTLYADSLVAGVYKVIATDSLGCRDSLTIVLGEVPCDKDTNVTHVSICAGDSVLFAGIYRDTSGIYRDSLINRLGCDSVNLLDLQVFVSTSSSITIAQCYSYTAPSGLKTYTSSGTYLDTIPNVSGCDSIITINLIINQASSQSLSKTVCNRYTVPSGHKTYTLSGMYADTIPNYVGCDSLLTINLTVLYSSAATMFDTVCDYYIVPSGDETYTSSGVYSDTIPNYTGCDSLLTINLVVNHKSSGSVYETVCSSYTVPSGDETYTTSGVYSDTIPNYAGCDSLLTINLTINHNSSSTVYETVCNSYTVPSGDETYISSGVYSDTINTYAGCDSLLSIYLTVNHNSSGTVYETVCNSYTVPSGDETYTSSGVYSDTISTSAGCDSLLTIYLTVNHKSTGTGYETVCNSYTVPSGDETYTSSGVYPDTISNYHGCDSLITINLTVNHNSTNTISETVCNSYTVPSGDETYISSGVYPDTISNYHGCDSLLTINLTVNHNSTNTISETVCYSYTVPSGDETYTASGIYSDTISNYAGCDSLLTINLKVNHTTSSISETACESYTVPSGDETYASSGVYYDTIINYSGCDSLITISLTIIQVDVSVSQLHITLTANAVAADYQWLNCDKFFAAIPGETQQQFIPDSSGNYAVQVEQSNCIDTSACYFVQISGIDETAFGDGFSLYPNPSSGLFTIKLTERYELLQLHVLDMSGRLILQQKYVDSSRLDIDLEGLKGEFLIILDSPEGKQLAVKVVLY
ncbi:FG-GAP-like repeat-containing protein, partial [Bacteroidota bacterium]